MPQASGFSSLGGAKNTKISALIFSVIQQHHHTTGTWNFPGCRHHRNQTVAKAFSSGKQSWMTLHSSEHNIMNVEHFRLSKSDWVPNNPHFPVVLYRQIGPDTDTCAFEDMFSTNGWTDIWRNGVFDYHHYHSRAHEVLGVGRGHAKLQIGGPDGPVLEVSKGDCLILPAGTGHKNLECSSDFQVVGAYPPGQEADIQRSHPTNDMLTTIRSLPQPNTDPVQGSAGALPDLWCNR